MNWRTFGMAAGAGAALFLTWLIIALASVQGIALYSSLVCAFLGAVLVGYLVVQVVGQGTPPSWEFVLITVLLGLILPGLAVLFWSAPQHAIPADAEKKPTGPHAVKDEGEEPGPDDILAGKAKNWKAGFKKAFEKGLAEGKKSPSAADHHLAKRAPFVVDPDGSGGAIVLINLPEARFLPAINTGLTADRGEAFYVYARATPSHMLVGCGEKGNPKTIWTSPPTWEFSHAPLEHSPYKGLRVRVTTLPEAELRFNVATAQPGSYILEIRKSPGPVGLLEYVPGVPAARVY